MASNTANAPDTINALSNLVSCLYSFIGFGPEIRALIGDEEWNKLGEASQEAHRALSRARGEANG